MNRKVVLALAVAALFATAVLKVAIGGTRLRVIARASASGDYAIALATARASRPRALFVRVRSKPRQEIDGRWMVECNNDSRKRSRSGEIHGRTPLTRRLRIPVAHPSNCSVSATAQLEGSGRITVQLLAR